MLSRSREHRCTDPAAFEEGMRQLVAKARPVTRFGMPLPGAFALNKLRIGEVLLEVTSLVRTHRVKVEPNFTNLVMAIVVLEGLGRQLDPSLDLFSIALELMPTLLLG